MQGSQTKQMRQWPELQKWSNAKLRSEIQSTVAELRKFEQKYRNQTASILATRFSGMNADQRKKISEENSAAVEKIYREEQQEFEEKINPKVQPLFEETVRRLELTQLPFEAGTIFRFGKYTGSEPVSKAADYLETLAKRLN
jgi:hypothetical protein